MLAQGLWNSIVCGLVGATSGVVSKTAFNQDLIRSVCHLQYSFNCHQDQVGCFFGFHVSIALEFALIFSLIFYDLVCFNDF